RQVFRKDELVIDIAEERFPSENGWLAKPRSVLVRDAHQCADSEREDCNAALWRREPKLVEAVGFDVDFDSVSHLRRQELDHSTGLGRNFASDNGVGMRLRMRGRHS